MTSTSNGVAAAYTQAAAPLTSTLAAISDWAAPSRCDGWTALDVLQHLMQTQRELFSTQGFEVPAEPFEPSGWMAHTAAVSTLLADPAIVNHQYDGYFGPTTLGDTLTLYYVFDMYVHRWDLDPQVRFTDDELAHVEAAVDQMGDTLYLAGICRPALPVTPAADRQTRLLARLGRVG